MKEGEEEEEEDINTCGISFHSSQLPNARDL